MSEKRISVSSEGTAGETTGLTNMPSSKRSRVTMKVLLLSRMKSGMIGVVGIAYLTTYAAETVESIMGNVPTDVVCARVHSR